MCFCCDQFINDTMEWITLILLAILFVGLLSVHLSECPAYAPGTNVLAYLFNVPTLGEIHVMLFQMCLRRVLGKQMSYEEVHIQ